MKYQEFYQTFRKRMIISLNEIRKIEEDFPKLNLKNRTEKWYIQAITKWRYIFTDVVVDENLLYYISNNIYDPSYISMEMALSHYHLIPEWVFTITAVSSKKTQEFNTQFGKFSYHSIKKNLMFGYALKKIWNHNYKIAEIEKAVLDFLYFKPDIATEKNFEELRFDCYEFTEQANITKMKKYAKYYPSKTFQKRVKDFISYVQQNA